LFSLPTALHHLTSFPTRRSSDLSAVSIPALAMPPIRKLIRTVATLLVATGTSNSFAQDQVPFDTWLSALKQEAVAKGYKPETIEIGRHTSELQSREKLVCRLLLE